MYLEVEYKKPMVYDSLQSFFRLENTLDYKMFVGYKFYVIPKSSNATDEDTPYEFNFTTEKSSLFSYDFIPYDKSNQGSGEYQKHVEKSDEILKSDFYNNQKGREEAAKSMMGYYWANRNKYEMQFKNIETNVYMPTQTRANA